MAGARRHSRSRAATAIVSLTLLGVVVVANTPTASASSTLSWSGTPSPLNVLVPGDSAPTLRDIGGTLQGVSCATTRFCVAIGLTNRYIHDTTLTQVWDGRRWSVAPRSGVVNSSLNAVSCPTPGFCAVVGASYAAPYENPYDPAPATSTLTEMWNGRDWTLVGSPNTASTDNQLASVSCVNKWFCVAVGTGNWDRTDPHPLIESWNGATWSIVPGPNLGPKATLGSVSCTSRAFCLALGSTLDQSSVSHPVAERWNGATWTVVASPHATTDNVSCVDRWFCMAAEPLPGGGIERWNGSSWTPLATPVPDSPYSAGFESASCTSRRFCVAVDNLHGPTPGAERWTIVVWNGANWSLAGTNVTNVSGGSVLHGTSCATSRYCFAVGGAGYWPTGGTAVLGRG